MKNLRLLHLIVFLLGFALTLSSFDAGKTIISEQFKKAPSSKRVRLEFEWDGLIREYLLYLPENLQPGAPLLLALHGISETSTAELAQGYFEMDVLADERGFAVAYPQGTRDLNNFYFWNVGYDFHVDETVDDLGFLKALALSLQGKHNLSAQNIFVTGFSNGGDACFMLLSKAADIFKAGSCGGAGLMLVIRDANIKHSVPVLIVNGTDDAITNWDGDMQNTAGWGAYLSVEDNALWWSKQNETTKATTYILPDINKNDNSTIRVTKYTHGINDNEVWLYAIIGGGHEWPGSWGNMDVEMSEHTWDFFQMYMDKDPAPTIPSVLEKPSSAEIKLTVPSATIECCDRDSIGREDTDAH